MSFDIALILAQDGITNGAVYALLAVALILVFTVTRITFVPQGEFVSYGALTLASIQQGQSPKTVWILLIFGLLAAAREMVDGWRFSQFRTPFQKASLYLGYPVAVLVAVYAMPAMPQNIILQIAMTFAIVVPLAPLSYRVVFQPMASASVLVLLIAAVAMHLAMVGMGLLVFGAEGSRTAAISSQSFNLGPTVLTGQSLAVIAVSGVLMAVLFWAFGHTLFGKALRATAVNQRGARLVGIRPEQSGAVCMSLAGAIGVFSGILLSPMTAIYYDSGFLIALKGFVAAIIGGLGSYPVAAAGAIGIGLVESFSSFWASAFKEAILFMLVIPILLWRCMGSRALLDETE